MIIIYMSQQKIFDMKELKELSSEKRNSVSFQNGVKTKYSKIHSIFSFDRSLSLTSVFGLRIL